MRDNMLLLGDTIIQLTMIVVFVHHSGIFLGNAWDSKQENRAITFQDEDRLGWNNGRRRVNESTVGP